MGGSIEGILESIRAELRESIDLEAKASSERFFKEEVKMYGMKHTISQKIGKKYLAEVKAAKLSKAEIFKLCDALWASGYQEETYIACQFSESQKKFYTADDFELFFSWIAKNVSNWAMCDTLCNHTVGDLLMLYPQLAEHLLEWTGSDNRWVRRAAAVSLIIPARQGLFLSLIFEIAEALLADPDDLVQKGYGWMLKAASEASASNQQAVFEFVLERKAQMPRTALRYAIEKMPADLKKAAMAR